MSHQQKCTEKQIKSAETGKAETSWNGSILKKILRYCDKIKPYTKHKTNRNSNINL